VNMSQIGRSTTYTEIVLQEHLGMPVRWANRNGLPYFDLHPAEVHRRSMLILLSTMGTTGEREPTTHQETFG
jgi:hypothetical protein